MKATQHLGLLGWFGLALGGLLVAEPTGPATLEETPDARAASDWALRHITALLQQASLPTSYNVWVSQPGALRLAFRDGTLGYVAKL